MSIMETIDFKLMRMFSILFISLLCSNFCYGSEEVRHYKQRKSKLIELKADLALECRNSNYIAEIGISNVLRYDILINVYEVGLLTPSHGSAFEVSNAEESSKVMPYKGKWINKDGVDISDELVTIKRGHRLSFNYNLSSDFEISPLDNSSYLVQYSVGAESKDSDYLIYIYSDELTVNSAVCTKH
ncbi:hypothetical protein [Kangiella spongicola]|uniref:Uncharacterized protein n=1 Tax=Kangiella spongicola TaxID=796379 RepID=A0A318D087_9GAMM|nr:hypothetical protein [Kangiella spongicola]PXF62640.1 hypothetical protein DL796_09935 [Kangiella spongicola]